MYNDLQAGIAASNHVLIIQPENPDGDSLGSALALEEILGAAGKKVTVYCTIDIPKYLRYLQGWSRVVNDWPRNYDMAIIVDTASVALLEKTLTPDQLSSLKQKTVFVLDHHETAGDLPFKNTAYLDEKAVATCELVFDIAQNLGWQINSPAAEYLAAGILSDSLGLTTPNTSAKSVRSLAGLVDLGISLADLENKRRELMKKPAMILKYKGELLQRIEYHLDGQLAVIHIPWDEIAEYSDLYNPSILVLDEMRLVEGVKIAAAFKTYPDTKITGKLRANADSPIAEKLAGFFGGGGHLYSAGFKVYDEDFNKVKNEFIGAADKILQDQALEGQKNV